MAEGVVFSRKQGTLCFFVGGIKVDVLPVNLRN